MNKPLTCYLCGTPLYGRYMTYSNGLIVCERCEQTVPHCSRCHLPSRQLSSVRGELICPACRQQAPVCDLCSEPILGSYKVYNNTLKVCHQCEQTVPRCSRCNIPSRQLTSVRGALICPDCLRTAIVCDCCHIPIVGSYSTIDGSPKRYCQTCMQTRPRCGVCTAPLNEQGRIFSGPEGETRRCGSCLSTAIKTPQEAEPLYRQVRALLMRDLALDIDVLPRLTLVGRNRMLALHRQAGDAAGPQTPTPGSAEPQHLLGFFHRFNEQRDIYIEHYLPKTLFQGVAAHELAHAWQSTHVSHQQSEIIVEGFAEWVAYRALMALGEQAEAERMTRRDDLYGQGLHYFLDLERKQGRKAVIKRAIE